VLAAAAQAQISKGKMSTVCKDSYCVYDRGGNILGQVQQAGIINRPIGNALYFAGFGAEGFIVDLGLFYLSTNCRAAPASGLWRRRRWSGIT
jgi:hypothetical protein